MTLGQVTLTHSKVIYLHSSDAFSASLEFANPWPMPVWTIFNSYDGELTVPPSVRLCAEGYSTFKVDTAVEEQIVILRGWAWDTEEPLQALV